jgi:uncharacterized protein YdhG (YjbR/CyaY superfamily)
MGKENNMSPEKEMQKEKKSKSASKGFSDFEKAAMQERAKELKAEERMVKDKAAGEKAVQDKISEMPEPERSMAKRIHEVIKANAPSLMPKTWYGMPAYANKAGKVVCFFQGAKKFETRYSTLGFNDAACLDEGKMWPTSYALLELTASVEAQITELVKKATR